MLVAPVIPGLNDHEIPAILAAAADAGARFAGYVPLRLPGAVAPLFERWLDQHVPGKKDKVLRGVRSLRGGHLNDPRFGYRMRGEAPFADLIEQFFTTGVREAGLKRGMSPLSTSAFRRPSESGHQGLLF